MNWRRHPGVRHSAMIVVLLWITLSLACNFPGFARIERPTPGISAKELRQTLAAMASGTVEAWTPAPGTPGPPTSNQGVPIPTLSSPLCGQLTEDGAFVVYCAQSGDTLDALAGRFGVAPEDITSAHALPRRGFIVAGQALMIPNVLDLTANGGLLLPDSEVINSPTAADFDVYAYVSQAGGFLSTYREQVKGEQMSGAAIIDLIATESSVNPRFLLAFLEHRSHWVLGVQASAESLDYPLGFHVSGQKGLYREMIMAATHFHLGYYGWRAGIFTEMKYSDGSRVRFSPMLNAGTAGVQNLFAKFYKPGEWRQALYGTDNFVALYGRMFGDPWARAAAVEPMFTPDLAQPALELPFSPGEWWSLTGGPHEAWKTGTPRGAVDLAPVTGEPECAVSRAWARASAPGLIVRSDRNAVALDLDGDGREQTGWVVLYFHVADKERIAAGSWVDMDDPLGHPSCEGGRVTGTHLHIARKYNGEWIAADGPLPFVMSGWQVAAYEKNYQGEMRRGDELAVASPVGPRTSIVVR